MSRYVTDTHCLIWHLTKDRRLYKAARSIFQGAENGRDQVVVPSIVLVEATFLAQRHRLSDAIVAQLLNLSENDHQTFYVYPLDLPVVHTLSEFGPAVVPELPDRVIAATARALNLPLMTVDPEIIQSGLVNVVE